MVPSVARAARGEYTTNGARQLLDAPPLVGSQIAPGKPSLVARCPEAKLMLAVLDNALDDLRRYARIENVLAQRRLAETLAWFEDDDTTWPYAFPNLCEVLGLDASAVRRQVRQGLPPLPTTGHRTVRGQNGGHGTRVCGRATITGRKAWV